MARWHESHGDSDAAKATGIWHATCAKPKQGDVHNEVNLKYAAWPGGASVRPTGALAGDHSSSQLDSLSGGLGKPDGAHRAPAGLGPCQRTRRGRAVTTGGLEPPLPRAHQGGLFSSSSSRTQWPAHPVMLSP